MKLNQTGPTHPSRAHPEPTEAEIQKAAYYLWQEKGCPDGNDLDTWLEAKELLRHRAPGATRPGTVKAPAIHFPTPHSTEPFPPASAVRASAHLDFRHTSPPFQPT